jgi:hypothetical protein
MDIEYISFTKIIVIESLETDHTGKDLYNDILKIRELQFEREFTADYVDISSKSEFTALLHSVLKEVNSNHVVPVFHFEIHGSEKGLELKNGDFIAWSYLVNYFRTVNSVTKNNLLVTFATCYSSYILDDIDLNEKCPFWSFISTHKKISNEDIAISYNAFYDTLLTERNIESAVSALTLYNQSKGLVLKFWNMETLLDILIENVEDNRFNNTVALKELEDEALNMFMERNPMQNPEYVRQIIKSMYRNRQMFYQNIEDEFLYK